MDGWTKKRVNELMNETGRRPRWIEFISKLWELAGNGSNTFSSTQLSRKQKSLREKDTDGSSRRVCEICQSSLPVSRICRWWDSTYYYLKSLYLVLSVELCRGISPTQQRVDKARLTSSKCFVCVLLFCGSHFDWCLMCVRWQKKVTEVEGAILLKDKSLFAIFLLIRDSTQMGH